MICVRIVWWIFWRGVVCGALLGAVFGTFLIPIIGTIYGFFYGAIIGFIMGAVDAFALGAVAHFFMDLANPSRVVPWLRLVGIVLNLIGVGIYAHQFFGTNFVTVIPPMIAAITIYFLCPRFVIFAASIQQEPTRNPPVNVLS